MTVDLPKQEQSASNGALLSQDFSYPTYEEWRKSAEQTLKGAPFEKKVISKTYEGIDLQPIYRQEDVAEVSQLNQWPGFGPYGRGSRASGYTVQPWAICQELPYPTAQEFNQAARYDLERGQTAISLLLDKATLLGQDPDEARVGDVGQGGVSIATVDDLAEALAEIDLEKKERKKKREKEQGK